MWFLAVLGLHVLLLKVALVLVPRGPAQVPLFKAALSLARAVGQPWSLERAVLQTGAFG